MAKGQMRSGREAKKPKKAKAEKTKGVPGSAFAQPAKLPSDKFGSKKR